MKAGLVRVMACSLSLALLAAADYLPAASAQIAPQDSQVPAYSPQQIDQLLAPIALYPDPLLAQILMAATYPLEVVEAARWVQDPNNARLQGDQLDTALQQQAWDPSVKSLVPFPQVLQMMNSKLDWTQALGNAFLAQQAGVMDSVQRLRAAAQAAGTLRSTPQQTVSTQGQAIMIEPADPQLAYVPYYDPTMVYGTWGYPDYPPVYFPPPPNYGYVAGPGIYFGVGFGVIGALWGWDQWDWNHHDIRIDPDRYNRINTYAIAHGNRPRYAATTWQHDPTQRRGVPYGNAGVRQQFQPAVAGSADAHRDFRGFGNRGGAPGITSPAAASQARTVMPQSFQRASTTPGGATSLPAVQRPVAPAFASFGNGQDVRAQSQRGQASRQSMAAAVPPPRAAAPQQRSAPQPQHGAPAGGGQRGKR
jgi:hypothetical protein